MATYKNNWSDNLTTHPSYGAIPLTTVSKDTIAADAVTVSSISLNDTLGLGGGYTLNTSGGGTGTTVWPTGSNTVWTTGTSGSGSFQINPDYKTTIGSDGRMSLKGDNADLEINGKSMKAWMERVEERLNILTPNPELEKDWDDLRRLGERYRKLEKKCKEKAEVWKKLKSMPKPEVKW